MKTYAGVTIRKPCPTCAVSTPDALLQPLSTQRHCCCCCCCCGSRSCTHAERSPFTRSRGQAGCLSCATIAEQTLRMHCIRIRCNGICLSFQLTLRSRYQCRYTPATPRDRLERSSLISYVGVMYCARCRVVGSWNAG